MTDKPDTPHLAKAPRTARPDLRGDRLASALKANIARRKAQAIAREDGASGKIGNDDNKPA